MPFPSNVFPTDPDFPIINDTVALDSNFYSVVTGYITDIAFDLNRLSDNAGNINLASDKAIKWNGTTVFDISGAETIHWGNLHITNKMKTKNAIYESLYDNGNSGVAKTIDWNNGNKQKITTTGSCTLTFTAPSALCSLQLIIIHENSATSYVYTFPATVKFPTDYPFVATPAIANAVDVLSLFFDGTNYYSMGNNNFV